MKPRHPIEMKITLDTDGNLSVTCTQLNDQIFCFGLLKQAELAIISHGIQQKMKKAMDKPTIISPNPNDLLNRGKI